MTRTKTKPTVLLVEDDEGLRSQLRWSLEGTNVVEASNRETAISQVRRVEPGVVILDLGLPPDPANATEGFAALQEILQLAPRTKVIVVTGNDDRQNAVRAVGLGAYDFFFKPIDTDLLGIVVSRAFRLGDLEDENFQLQRDASQTTAFGGLLGASAAMVGVLRTIEKVAKTHSSVLLLGESGTGKELIARSLHKLSDRGEENFVAINCAAIPGELLESELFGYEKGAFTGAIKTTLGKIEYAHRGTLFLDEIGDLPTKLQAKLLRFLQERVIERIGGREEIPIDVRILCATHQDIQSLIREKIFREDLYYRISEVSISIPPLRERPGDALMIAHYLLANYRETHGKSIGEFTPDAIRAIERHEWRGNVRELENAVRKAVIMSDGGQISAADLGVASAQGIFSVPLNLREAREQAERSAIVHAIATCGGNISVAAKELGVSRPTLYSLMHKYHVQKWAESGVPSSIDEPPS